MGVFTKDVLYPGAYWVPDGKGGRRKEVFDAAKVQQLHRRMQEMLAAGLSIPLAAEHQDRAKPLTEEERKADWVKRLTLGWAEAAEMPEEYLSARVNVPEPEDEKAIRRVRFVSPEIVHDFRDGTGRLWPGPSITHLAVTPRPVNIHQKPFQPVQLSQGPPPGIIRLSLTDYEASMPEDSKPDDKPTETPAEPKASEGGFDLEALRQVLEGDGYSIPSHITEPTQFLEHLHTAALSKKAMIDKALGGEEEEEEETPVAPESGQPEPAPASGPIMMSLGGRKFTLTPVKPAKAGKPGKGKPGTAAKPPVQMSHGPADPRTSKHEARLLKLERDGLLGRIDRLWKSGRISRPIKEQLVQQAGTVRLSLDDSGALEGNTVLAKVEAYEALPESAAWPATGELPPGVSPAAPSGQWSPEDTPAAAAEQVDAFFETLGR